MVMHRKEDLKLPDPIFRQIEREVTIPPEVESAIMESAAIGHSFFIGNNTTLSYRLSQSLQEYLHSPSFQSAVDDSRLHT